MVEEFVDRVLRAEKVKNEWRKFLRNFRIQVWSEQFRPLAKKNLLIKDWLKFLEQALAINMSSNIQFEIRI
jgi:recombinational DNA repair protein RecT